MITVRNGHLLLERVLRVLKIIILSALQVGRLLHAIIRIWVGNYSLPILITLVGAKRVRGSHARQLRIVAIRRGMHGLYCRGQRVVPVRILICLICHLSHCRFRNITLKIYIYLRVVAVIVGYCLDSRCRWSVRHTPSSNVLRRRRSIIHDTGLHCRAKLRCVQLTQRDFKWRPTNDHLEQKN